MATNPWSWASYSAPAMTQAAGTAGTEGFWRPANSQLPTGAALNSYLNPGTVEGNINRTTKYDGALTREQIMGSTGFLNDAMGKGFGGLTETLNNFGSLGGLGGMSGASPVYRPNGAAVGQGATNGQPLPWGVSNPFNQTF